MKIAYIVPGAGGSFYCGNCMRDSAFIQELNTSGHEVVVIPMYLPISLEKTAGVEPAPIFYGAVSIYLKQLVPLLKRLPRQLLKFLDSKTILGFAASMAGSTRAAGLGEMTISMLKGADGGQADDLEFLIQWFHDQGKPDVVHLSNALLLGLAPRFKKEFDSRVICSLQDEDEWIEDMAEPFKTDALNLIKSNSVYVDTFIAVSHFYENYAIQKLHIPAAKTKVIYNGVNRTEIAANKASANHHTIGFMSKMNQSFGLDILIDAYILLKKNPLAAALKLRITGGSTSDDKAFIRQQKNKIAAAGLAEMVDFTDEFEGDAKINFFRSISLYCVPAIRHEACGMHLLEAIGAGIPAIQPDHGAYSEIINSTGAGILYQPNTAETLANSIFQIISNDAHYATLKQNCITGIDQHFNSKWQTEKVIQVYVNNTETLVKSQ